MHKLLTKLFGVVANWLLRFCCGTNSLTITRMDILQRHCDDGSIIYAFWHNRLFYNIYYYATKIKTPQVSALMSMSKDGDYAAAITKKIGQDVIRGSSSRGARRAILQLAKKAKAGFNLVITPDGPRGPVYNVQEGIIKLAQLTGQKILPVSYDATKKKRLKSWDKFIIVKPFGKIHLAFAEPITIPKDADSKQIEQYRVKLQTTLLELNQICAEKLGLDESEDQKQD